MVRCSTSLLHFFLYWLINSRFKELLFRAAWTLKTETLYSPCVYVQWKLTIYLMRLIYHTSCLNVLGKYISPKFIAMDVIKDYVLTFKKNVLLWSYWFWTQTYIPLLTNKWSPFKRPKWVFFLKEMISVFL